MLSEAGVHEDSGHGRYWFHRCGDRGLCLVQRSASGVAVFDFSDSTQRLDDAADQVTATRGNLANLGQVLDAVRSTEAGVIYHMGGMLSLPSEQDPQSAFESNAVGPYHVLEAARILNVRQVVFASTIGVFTLEADETTVNDLSRQRPHKSCTKSARSLESIWACSIVAGTASDFRGIRYPSIVGPGVRILGSVQYTTRMIEESARGKPVCRLGPTGHAGDESLCERCSAWHRHLGRNAAGPHQNGQLPGPWVAPHGPEAGGPDPGEMPGCRYPIRSQ